MDLLVCAPSEFARMGIAPFEQMLLVDFKTSSAIGRYALTPTELAADLQSNLYGLAVMHREAMPRIDARWVYVETKERRRAAAVDVTIERSRAEDTVGEAAEVARRLCVIPSSADATPNPTACGDYGGCEYHRRFGGPCDGGGPGSVGAMIHARANSNLTTKGTPIMTLTPEMHEKLAKLRIVTAAATPDPEPKPEPEPEPELPPAAKRGRGRPPKTAAVETSVMPLVATATGLRDLVAAIEAAEADLAAAKQALREALG